MTFCANNLFEPLLCFYSFLPFHEVAVDHMGLLWWLGAVVRAVSSNLTSKLKRSYFLNIHSSGWNPYSHFNLQHLPALSPQYARQQNLHRLRTLHLLPPRNWRVLPNDPRPPRRIGLCSSHLTTRTLLQYPHSVQRDIRTRTTKDCSGI